MRGEVGRACTGREPAFFTPVDCGPGAGFSAPAPGSIPVMVGGGGTSEAPFPCVMIPAGSELAFEIAAWAASPPGRLARLIGQASSGLLMPLVLHNLNNRFVGVVGNLDLAHMFEGQPGRSLQKAGEAWSACEEVRAYLDVLGRLPDTGGAAPETTRLSAAEAAVRVASAGRGRSVILDADPPGSGGQALPSAAMPVCRALACAALLSVRGSGSIRVSGTVGEPGGVAISWSRSGSGRREGDPSSSQVPSILGACAIVAVDAGMTLDLSGWGDADGCAVVAPVRGGDCR